MRQHLAGRSHFDLRGEGLHRGRLSRRRGSSDQLDLTAADVYESLVNCSSSASLSPPINRVTPGDQNLSLLYLKVAAATTGMSLPSGAGSPMPVAQTPLSDAQLTALKLWLRAGAPEHGVVAETQELLACAQPTSADPNRAPRPAAPRVEQGVQHVAGPWTVAPGSESEVCFATFYDLTESPRDICTATTSRIRSRRRAR